MVLGVGAGDGLGGRPVRRSGEGRARREMSTVGSVVAGGEGGRSKGSARGWPGWNFGTRQAL